jgi:cystathionine beta-synthase
LLSTPQHLPTTTDPLAGATIASLRLKPVISISAESPCSEAIETMRDKGFDQLPVVSGSSDRLVGLVTLGNLLSYLSSGRAKPTDIVKKVMFDFTTLRQVPDILGAIPESGKRKFIEITRDTPLSALGRFFEWNSAAVVTEKKGEGLKAIGVVTKVDLLTFLVKHQVM